MADLPPEHLGNIPAGHKRNEENRKRTDKLAERKEVESEKFGIGAIDPAKMEQRDNEIVRHVDPISGDIPVENPQPGYRYARVTVSDGYGPEAQISIRMMHQELRRWGWHPVSGPDPEDKRFEGNDRATGTSLRGVGDTILYRIREEDYRRLESAINRKLARQGAVEENVTVFNDKLHRAGVRGEYREVVGDFSGDPRLSRYYGAAGQREIFTTTFDENDLRRGTITGPDGRPLQPGFDQRR
jgi:hypothetical protein